MAGRQCISLIKVHSTRLLNNQGTVLARSAIVANKKFDFVGLSTSAILCGDDVSKGMQLKDPKQVTLDDAAKTVEDLAHDAALKGLITVQGPADITAVSVRYFFVKYKGVQGRGKHIYEP